MRIPRQELTGPFIDFCAVDFKSMAENFAASILSSGIPIQMKGLRESSRISSELDAEHTHIPRPFCAGKSLCEIVKTAVKSATTFQKPHMKKSYVNPPTCFLRWNFKWNPCCFRAEIFSAKNQCGNHVQFRVKNMVSTSRIYMTILGFPQCGFEVHGRNSAASRLTNGEFPFQ